MSHAYLWFFLCLFFLSSCRTRKPISVPTTTSEKKKNIAKDSSVSNIPETKTGIENSPKQKKLPNTLQKALVKSKVAEKWVASDLLSFREQKKWNRLQRYLQTNQCSQAEKYWKKASPKEVGWKILLGRCWLEKKNGAQARLYWEEKKYRDGIINDYISLWTSRSWEKEKNWEAAARSYQTVSKESPFYVQAQIKRVENLLKGKKTKEALLLLQTEKRLKNHPRRFYWLGKELLKSSPKQALSFWRELLVRFPTSGEAQEVEEKLRARKIRMKWTLEEKVQIAKKYNHVFLYKKALEALQSVRPSSKSKVTLCWFYYSQGFSNVRLRRYKNAIPLLTKAETYCKKNVKERHIRVLYWLATAQKRRGKTEPAIRWFQKLSNQYPDHFLADDALYDVARIFQKKGQSKKAQETYKKLLKQFSKGDMSLYARWQLGFEDFKGKRYTQAIRKLLAFQKLAPQHSQAPASLYFAAKSHQKSNKKKQALSLYSRLVREYPMHWYSFLALSRLKQLQPKKKWLWKNTKVAKSTQKKKKKKKKHLQSVHRIPWWKPSSSGSFQQMLSKFKKEKHLFLGSSFYKRGVALFQLGFFEEASREWLRLKTCTFFQPSAKRQRKSHGCGYYGDSGSLLFAFLLQQAKSYHEANSFFRRHGRLAGQVAMKKSNPLHWFLAYPRPFYEHVSKWAKQYKVPVSLVYALMREESGFNPTVTSWANAYGLMQMILPTAQKTARKVFPKLRITPQHLKKPAINIRLGIKHMRELLDIFRDHYPMILGGYNAGAGWVNRWLRRNGALPYDEWVEAVSISQTRKYIQRVSQSFAIYRFLYEKENQPWKLLRMHPDWKPSRALRK